MTLTQQQLSETSLFARTPVAYVIAKTWRQRGAIERARARKMESQVTILDRGSTAANGSIQTSNHATHRPSTWTPQIWRILYTRRSRSHRLHLVIVWSRSRGESASIDRSSDESAPIALSFPRRKQSDTTS
ncbi:hypothetical protein FI667_g9866, partial [Globisporangium splendens]